MKTRTEWRTRLVPHTRNGQTQMVPDEYSVDVPQVPRDWDNIALRAVTLFATVAVLGAVVWSAVSIGDLLSHVAPPWAAYTVAGVFDLAWIVCNILEWISRFDRDRAQVPMIAGWVALVVSMVLISIHGHVEDALTIGIAGAFVSLIAKGIWTVVMHFHSVKLDPKDIAFMRQRRAETTMQAAHISEDRRLSRMQDKMMAQRLSLGQPVPGQVVSRTEDKTPEPDRTLVSGQIQTDRGPVPTDRPNVSAFVRGLLSTDSDMKREQALSIALPEFGPDSREAILKAYTRARKRLNV